jgi:hypothetical protein
MKENDRGRICSTHSDDTCKGRDCFGDLRHRWEDNIWMDLKAIGWKCVNWIQLAKDGDQWGVHVNTIMNVRVALVAGNSLTTWTTIKFSRKTLLHEVNVHIRVSGNFTCHLSFLASFMKIDKLVSKLSTKDRQNTTQQLLKCFGRPGTSIRNKTPSFRRLSSAIIREWSRESVSSLTTKIGLRQFHTHTRKGKLSPCLTKATSSRRIGEWRYNCTHS